MTTDIPTFANVVVVGAGIAGLSAAVSAAESLQDTGGTVLLVDQAPEREAGGNTRWTSAYLRLDDVYDTGPDFVNDVVAFSGGRTDVKYVEQLADLLPETMDWAQGHGMRFRRQATYFINSVRKRQQPVGGGEAMLRALTDAARQLGVIERYDSRALRLDRSVDGSITGLFVVHDGREYYVAADAVIIASGGFGGDPERLERALGPGGGDLLPIAPGGAWNRGDGIDMAIEAGAARDGQWDGFHAEPVDPRSDHPESIVMVFPYGIVVDRRGQRFFDEGHGTVDETYESFARLAWKRDGGIVYFITDQQFLKVDDRARGVLSPLPPLSADSIDELALALDVPADALRETITSFNAATHDGAFDWRVPDGLSTSGIEPVKSNWALPITDPPYLAYPISCSIVFTFGGIRVDVDSRVLRDDGLPLDGLYAAGECTGIYFGKYPGGTSVLRGMVFGKVAGRRAAERSLARSRPGVDAAN